eukprot:2286388-Rhodomonas_salina.1
MGTHLFPRTRTLYSQRMLLHLSRKSATTCTQPPESHTRNHNRATKRARSVRCLRSFNRLDAPLARSRWAMPRGQVTVKLRQRQTAMDCGGEDLDILLCGAAEASGGTLCCAVLDLQDHNECQMLAVLARAGLEPERECV